MVGRLSQLRRKESKEGKPKGKSKNGKGGKASKESKEAKGQNPNRTESLDDVAPVNNTPAPAHAQSVNSSNKKLDRKEQKKLKRAASRNRNNAPLPDLRSHAHSGSAGPHQNQKNDDGPRSTLETPLVELEDGGGVGGSAIGHAASVNGNGSTGGTDWNKFFDRFFPKSASNQIQKNLKQLIKKDPRKVNRQMLKRAYDGGKVWKLGTLQKQGGRIKTWKTRFFVLRRKVLFYFESKDAFEAGEPPKGWIFVREMQPRKNGFVCQPTPFFAWRGKINAFTIDADQRTFVICAKTKEERLEWMQTIQKAFEDFWKSYGLKIPVNKHVKPNLNNLNSATNSNTGNDKIVVEDTEQGNEQLLGLGTETVKDLLPLAEQLDTFDILEESEIEEKTRLLVLAKCMLKWKTYVKINKAERAEEASRNLKV